MTVTDSPVLDLQPIYEGDAATTPRITQENFRRIMEWAMLLALYLDTIDGGGP